MSLYLNRPQIFGNTAGSYSKLLQSYSQQIYIVCVESGDISVFTLLLVKTSFLSSQDERGISQYSPRISGARAHQNQTIGVETGWVSQCHSGVKCSELMSQDGGNRQMQRPAPLLALAFSEQTSFCTRTAPTGQQHYALFYTDRLHL